MRDATSSVVIPVVSAYGPSGGGKTLSMLLYARGIVGPKGKICLVDSENKRGSLFADQIPGSYKVIDLEAPFSPGRYQAAIDHACGIADIVVVDSMSHEWEGPGGVLDWQEEELHRMSGGDHEKAERMKMLSWKDPKRSHKALLQWMLLTPKPLILCFRAEKKTHFDEDTSPPKPDAIARELGREEKRKRSVVTDKFTTPIGAKNFVWDCLITYEMTMQERDGLMQGGFAIPRKWTHPNLMPLLPKPNEQITIKHGEALGEWCRRKAGAPAGVPAGSSKGDARTQALSDIRDITVSVHGWKKADGAAAWALSKAKLNQWLLDENFISDTQTLDSMTADELVLLLGKLRERFGGLL